MADTATLTSGPRRHGAPEAGDHKSVVRLSLARRVDGRLWATKDGVEKPVSVRRCFPWSHAAEFVSLRDDDEEELALVENPAELDPASRAALEQALVEAAFVLDVTRVLSITEEVEIYNWRVETRQGTRSFQIRLDDWPLQMPGGGLLIRDLAGDLYYIARPGEMDKESRALLWAFVD